MTGPEHYRKAEELLERAAGCHKEGARTAHLVAMAQVHATLAQAAAAALKPSDDYVLRNDWWKAAA